MARRARWSCPRLLAWLFAWPSASTAAAAHADTAADVARGRRALPPGGRPGQALRRGDQRVRGRVPARAAPRRTTSPSITSGSTNGPRPPTPTSSTSTRTTTSRRPTPRRSPPRSATCARRHGSPTPRIRRSIPTRAVSRSTTATSTPRPTAAAPATTGRAAHRPRTERLAERGWPRGPARPGAQGPPSVVTTGERAFSRWHIVASYGPALGSEPSERYQPRVGMRFGGRNDVDLVGGTFGLNDYAIGPMLRIAIARDISVQPVLIAAATVGYAKQDASSSAGTRSVRRRGRRRHPAQPPLPARARRVRALPGRRLERERDASVHLRQRRGRVRDRSRRGGRHPDAVGAPRAPRERRASRTPPSAAALTSATARTV